MELTKQPVTELEYYGLIEELGGMRWSINHSLSHPERFGFNTETILSGSNQIEEIYNLQKKLVEELEEKFGVVPPGKDVPEGETPYWDWYHKTKGEYNKMLYSKNVCYLCPFTKGEAENISNPGGMNCNKLSGCGRKELHHCWRIFLNDITFEQLLIEITQNAGEDMVNKFKKRYKSHALIENLNKVPNIIDSFSKTVNHESNSFYKPNTQEIVDSLNEDINKLSSIVNPFKDAYTDIEGLNDKINEILNIYVYLKEKAVLCSGKEIKEEMIDKISNLGQLAENLQKDIWENL